MPALRAYRSKEGHYALAGIKGRIVTYRLSPDGAKRLHDSGILDDCKFPWSLLLELIRQGDAFTGSGVGGDADLSGWTQQGFVFDIPNHEPAITDPVPLCGCGSMEGLHVVGLAAGKAAIILCDACRTARLNDIEASVPIYLITTPTALERLLERDGLTPDATVIAYRDLLSLNLVAKYRAKARPKGASVQNVLFPVPEEPQQRLL
jgi:hypothetical protein